MRSIRTLIAIGVVAALAVTAMAAPVSAASMGRMTVINGIPGTKIDVCIGSSKEIRSGLKYGGVYKKQLTGIKRLRFRKASPGTCTGKILAGRTVGFPSGSDKTVVVTSKVPKVLVFNNANLGTQTAVVEPDGALAIRHAADLGWNTVHFRRVLWKKDADIPFTPNVAAVDPLAFEKGDEYTGPTVVNPDYVVRVKVTRPDPAIVLAKSPVFEVGALKRYEFIFVGTNTTNVKLVRVISGLSSPPAP